MNNKEYKMFETAPVAVSSRCSCCVVVALNGFAERLDSPVIITNNKYFDGKITNKNLKKTTKDCRKKSIESRFTIQPSIKNFVVLESIPMAKIILKMDNFLFFSFFLD